MVRILPVPSTTVNEGFRGILESFQTHSGVVPPLAMPASFRLFSESSFTKHCNIRGCVFEIANSVIKEATVRKYRPTDTAFFNFPDYSYVYDYSELCKKYATTYNCCINIKIQFQLNHALTEQLEGQLQQRHLHILGEESKPHTIYIK